MVIEFAVSKKSVDFVPSTSSNHLIGFCLQFLLSSEQGYDRPIGIFILSVTTVFIVYYSLWIILVPLLNEDHIIPSLFPKISIGLLLGIPVAIGTTFFLAIVIFSIVQMRAYKPKSKDE